MRRIGILLALTTLAHGCFESSGTVTRGRETPQTIERSVSFTDDDELRGLRMRLREVDAPFAATVSPPMAEGDELPPARIEQLLKRVEALETGADDRQAFARREDSPPPPLTGETLDLPFPPPEEAPATDQGGPGKLEVLRYAPEGEIPMAPHLSVTFSRPMVSLSSQEEAARFAPLELSPEPDGRWRWLGTRTLLFEPDGRFPMATHYRVSIPAGTESATGDRLGQALGFAFSTPPLSLEQTYPTHGPVGLEPVIFVAFDQRVDPRALLPFLKLTGGGTYPLRLASDEEIEADSGARSLRAHAQEGRWIALKPEQAHCRGTPRSPSHSRGVRPRRRGPGRRPGRSLSTSTPMPR